MAKRAPQLLLVDGSSYLFRAYHKLPPLTGPKGQPTGAAYGVVNMLRKLVRDESPDRIGVIFDGKGKNFRHDLFPEYKAQRPSMPDDLAAQIPVLRRMIEAFGYLYISPPNIEADDVIGTLAKRGEEAGFEVLISTGDKDIAQLVNKRITLVNTMERDPKKARMDERGVKAKFGVTPAQIPDYLALVGDKSDNIPGVPGVGAKTAAGYLAQFKDIEGVKAHADEIKGKRGEDLRATLGKLPLFLDLVTLRCDMDVGVTVGELHAGEPDVEALKALCVEYGFRTWLDELDADDGGGGADKSDDMPDECELIDVADKLEAWCDKLRATEMFALDVCVDRDAAGETTLVGLALSAGETDTAYIPLGHGEAQQLKAAEVWRRIKGVFAAQAPGKLGCGLKRAMHLLRAHGIALNGAKHDVALSSYVYNSVAVRHRMPDIAAKYVGWALEAPGETGKGGRRAPFAPLPAGDVAAYYAGYMAAVWRAHQFFDANLDAPLRTVYADIEMPLLPVLERVEAAGVMVDVAGLKRHSKDLGKRIKALERDIYAKAGGEFNIASTRQLAEVLFQHLGLSPPAIGGKTAKGRLSTNESVLKALAHQHEVPKMILEYRFASKIKSTYTDRLTVLADEHDRVHTTLQQNVTATGRLSSVEPNLQNIPVRTPAGREIRRCFVAPEGRRLIAADYSQIELRIMAHLSGDPALCDAFQRGEDIHASTAAELFGIPADKVGDEQRRRAKAINFGLIYGMTPFGLAQQVGISRAEADEYYKIYFARYTRVKEFIDKTRASAAEKGYVETVFGRRLYVPEIGARHAVRRRAAERAAINAPMQGTAADLIKAAMIAFARRLDESGMDAAIVLQVHDELVLEAAADVAEEAARACAECMATTRTLDVPLVVDAQIGDNWEEAH